MDIDGQTYTRWEFGDSTLFIDADIALNNVVDNRQHDFFAGSDASSTFAVIQNSSFPFTVGSTLNFLNNELAPLALDPTVPV